MSRIIKLCLAVSALVICSLIALAADQPVIGVVSFIEIGAKSGSESEPGGYRGLLPSGENARTSTEHSFVEVIQVPRWNAYMACKKTGAKNCDSNPQLEFEWSVPYITEYNSEHLEEDLSRAWNRYDSRTVWRLNAYMNSYPDPEIEDASFKHDCLVNQVEDQYIDAWNNNLLGVIQTDEFCEGKDSISKDRNLEPDTVEAYTCEDKKGKRVAAKDAASKGYKIKSINWAVYQKRFEDVLRKSDSFYNSDYWKDVYTAINKWMPFALNWDGVRNVGGSVGTLGGSIISPVYSAKPNLKQYIDLANQAQTIDSRGYNYIMQQYKGQMTSKANLKKVAGDVNSPENPGLSPIERLKYGLADPHRDIFYKSPPMKWSARSFGLSSDSEPPARPKGSKGLGTMEEQQNVGHVIFLRVWARTDLEYTPREVNVWVKCGGQTLNYLISRVNQQGTQRPPSTVELVPGCCTPVTYRKTRVHTDWKSVPEGYQIPEVTGIPSIRYPSLVK
jgi:hypothetical protein